MARVLIADDDQNYIDAFCSGLEALGHQTLGVTSGDELFEKLEGFGPDVVFLDVIMPGGGAITLIHRLHERHPSLPMIALTGQPNLAGSPLMKEGMRLAEARLTKTVGLPEIDTLVRRLTPA